MGASLSGPDLVTRPTHIAREPDDMASFQTSSSETDGSTPADAGSLASNNHSNVVKGKMPVRDDTISSGRPGIVEHAAELNPSHPALGEKHTDAAMIHPTPLIPGSSSGITALSQRFVDLDLSRTQASASMPPPPSPSAFSRPASPSPTVSGVKGDRAGSRKGPRMAPSLPDMRSNREQHRLRRNNHDNFTDSPFYDDDTTFSSELSSASGSQTILDNSVAHENDQHFPPRLPASRPFSSKHKRVDAIKRIQTWIADNDGPQATSSSSRRYSVTTAQSERSGHRSPSETSSSSSHDFDPPLENLWRERRQRQQRVDEIRDQMVIKRSQLRQLRPRLYAADNTFMNLIRPILVHNHGSSRAKAEQIDKSFAYLQQLRTERQDLEDALEEFEDEVDEEEFHLRRIELRFYSTLGGEEHDLETSSAWEAHGQTGVADNIPPELQGIPSDRPLEDLDPLFVKLKLAVANLRNEREELISMQAFKDQCSETIWLKKRNQQTVPPDFQDFVKTFPARQASKKEDIAQIDHQVRRLKQVCEDKQVMSKHMSPEMMIELYPDKNVSEITLPSELEILAKPQNLAHPIFNVLLSQPEHLLEKPLPIAPDDALKEAQKLPTHDLGKPQKVQKAQKENSIDLLLKGNRSDEGVAGFIDRWILFGLRNSPIEIVRLYNTFISTLSIRNLRQWQCDVMQFWDVDHAAEDMHQSNTRRSEYYSVVGTLPRSRAATEGTQSIGGPKMHRRAYSGGVKSTKTR